MKILSWNVNGLRSILKKDLGGQSFEDLVKDYDIVALQETKLSCKVHVKCCPDFLYKYFSHCENKPGSHGVVVFSKIKPVSTESSIKGFSGRYLQLEFEKFYFITVYSQNSGTVGLEKRCEWDHELYEKLKGLKKPVVICGDFNVVQLEIDTYNFKGHRNKLAGIYDIERYNFSKLLGIGFINVYRWFHPKTIGYTYFSYLFPARLRNKGLTLDYFLVSKNIIKKIKSVKILGDVYGSDHVPLEIKMD
jgi:exodeoxyribonuclease-3